MRGLREILQCWKIEARMTSVSEKYMVGRLHVLFGVAIFSGSM